MNHHRSWVKMGCYLPGPSNPGITGNQPFFFFFEKERYSDAISLANGGTREACTLNFEACGLVHALRDWVEGARPY